MKRFVRSKRFRVLLALIGVLCGAWAIGAAWDTYKVMQMTEKMKTVCVGRMLIDLPEEAQLELYGGRINAFDIDAVPEGPEEFRTRMAAREAEIRAKPDRLGGNNNMELVREVKTDAGLSGKIFVHGREITEGYSSDGFTREHFRYEGVAMEAHVHGKGISIDMTTDFYDPERVDFLQKLVSQLVANPANHIPAEPGFCIDRVYIRDPLPADEGERITLAVKLPSRPDIGINFDTIAGTKPDPRGLIERSNASRARFPAVLNARVTDLRATARTIGGLAGDELVQRVIESNLAIVYGFEWEVSGTEDNVFIPALSLRMVTGRGKDEPVRSSLSEPAALALWDKIVSSIRVRPAAASKAAATETPAVPLGKRVIAGETCPQTGWWECAGGDDLQVHGGTRQYFRQGARMPQALLLPPRSLWEKIRGIQPSHEAGTPTTWTLVSKRKGPRLAPAVPLADATPAPTAASTGETGKPSAATGSHATTGSPCPESGWWRCEDAERSMAPAGLRRGACCRRRRSLWLTAA